MTWTKITDDKKATSGKFVKWTDPGQALEGAWAGTTRNDYGDLGQVKTDDGVVTFSLTKVLADKLIPLTVGQPVRIGYIGETKSAKSGRTFKNFDIYVDEGVANESISAANS